MLIATEKRACPCAFVRLFICSRVHPDTQARYTEETEVELSRERDRNGRIEEGTLVRGIEAEIHRKGERDSERASE